MEKEYIKNSKFGKIYFKFKDDTLVKIKYLASSDKPLSQQTNKAVEHVLKYLKSPTVDFSKLKIKLKTTEFQKKVLKELKKIPAGETITYQELAARINSHPRPVAGALRHNPLPIIYPCHRVVTKKGIGGFAGRTEGEMPRIKRRLLEHEGAL